MSAVTERDLPQLPMGRLDTIDLAAKKMTIQTEFFPRPEWRVETKVYLAGALKKVYNEDLSAREPHELQQLVNDFHDARMAELTESLKKLKG